MIANVSLAVFPGLDYSQALQRGLVETCSEPLLGALATEHVQLVPQGCRQQLTMELAQEITLRFPATRFRLHANVRVLKNHNLNGDLAAWRVFPEYFAELARISRGIAAPAYSAHAGERAHGSLSDVLVAAQSAADLFGCPVAVEGHYPTPREPNRWNISSWDEYQLLFESGVPYALDLSHLNIVAFRSGSQQRSLVTEMLACERCIEIHLSDNDGRGDQHQVLNRAPWWWSLQPYFNPAAVVFSEGNQKRQSAATIVDDGQLAHAERDPVSPLH